MAAFNSFPRLDTTGSSPLGSKESSPVPERLATLQHDPPKRGPSPCLPRKTIEELDSTEFSRQEGTIDPDDPPLRTPWTFWFERAQASGTSSNDYSQALKSIYTVHTIKQFFSVYNNLRAPSSLKSKECYHLMRTFGEGETTRKPLWEDPENLSGGIWVFKCRKEMTVNVWLELLLAAIGEQFTDSTAEGDDVFGISIKIREFETDTLQIWNQNAELSGSAKVMDRVRKILPQMDIRGDFFYSSIKDKLSGSRPYHTPSHRESQPSQTHPRHSFNPNFTSHRQPTPPRGGFKKSPEGYYRHPSPHQ